MTIATKPTDKSAAHAHSTRARTTIKKKNDAAEEELKRIVAAEKKVREERKKQRAAEKKAEEEKQRKSDEEKAQATLEAAAEARIRAATISTPNPDIAQEEGTTDDVDDETQGNNIHSITPNHLFGQNDNQHTTPSATIDATVDLTTENSPLKKKTKNTTSTIRSDIRYTTSAFSVAQKAHVHTYGKTFIEGAITLSSEDKPKEFIASIKLIITNGKYLDPAFALSPLKTNNGNTKSRLITKEDDVPTNFTHLGQYIHTSGNRIFEKKKIWHKATAASTTPLRDHEAERGDTLKDPVVYFTFAIATDVVPRTLIEGIKTEWETHGGGRLQVKELQSQESKVVLALYYVYTGTPYNIILKTIQAIMNDVIHTREHERMNLANDVNYNPKPAPQITLRSQVPRLKGIDSSSFDKLPYHVRENRKVLHIETDPDNEAYLKELIQIAKERNFVGLFLGKRAHISEVMDSESTPGEIKRMVKFAMGHANYQGSMTGETISGIYLIDGAVPFNGGGDISLRQILFTYFKMKDKFAVFTELHQPEEMGPVLAIIPACAEAERLVQMMNKQVAAFLYYFLVDASLPEDFIRSLLKKTRDPTLVQEINKCEWDSDTQSLTTEAEKKENEAIEDLESASWYKTVFDMQSLSIRTSKPVVDKAPEDLFDIDADANSYATIHNRHLKPTYTVEEEDDESEAEASAAVARPATLPRKNPNKETTENNNSLTDKVDSPQNEEAIEDACAAGGG